MRADGAYAYYLIQHASYPPGGKRWIETNLAHFLFRDLPHDDARDEVGDRYRALLAPQDASSDLWQKTGIHGFPTIEEAQACLDAIRLQNPDREFRLVYRVSRQETHVCATVAR